jgi:hypothetical protein
MTYEHLVISPSEYKVILMVGKIPWPLFTLESIDLQTSREIKEVFYMGQENPGLIKRNRARYTGSLIIQIGEILSVMNSAGFVESTQLTNSILAITSLNLNGLKRVYSGLNINTENISLKSTDKDSLVTLGWNALEISGIAL